jgi:transcriptional regulator with XRE-family HTH domain
MKDNCQGPNPLSGVRLARILHGYTQDQIAAAASVDQAIVSRAERGCAVSPDARKRIAKVLEMSEEVLFPGR